MTSALGSVIAASASAVAKVFVIGTIGYVAAIRPRPTPILPPHAMTAISKMNFDLLVLPLIYTTLASAVTPEKLGSLWFILVSAVGVICLSYGVASFLGMLPFFKVDNKTDFDALRVAATFPNIIALPILIFPTLCEFPAVYDSFYDDGSGSSSETEKIHSCTEESNTMIFIYFFAWNLVYWIFGHPTLISAGKKRQMNNASSQTATEHHRSVDSFESDNSIGDIDVHDDIDRETNSNVEGDTNEAGDIQHEDTQTIHRFQKAKIRIKSNVHLIANGVLKTIKSPGFLAMVLGFITACIPPLQNSMFSSGGALRFLGSALESLGSASAAVGTLIVAASLVHQASDDTPAVGRTDSFVCQSQEERNEETTQGHGEVSTSRDFRAVMQRRRTSISQFSIKTMAAIRRRTPTMRMHAWFFFSRHLVTPAIVCLIILAMDCGSILDAVPNMAKMVVIVNSGLPGAQLIVLTLKAKGLSDSASIVAKVYLPSYLLSVITIAAWTSIGLLISRYDSTQFCKR